MSMSDFRCTFLLIDSLRTRLLDIVGTGDQYASNNLRSLVSRLVKSTPADGSSMLGELHEFSKHALTFLVDIDRSKKLVDQRFLNGSTSIHDDPFVSRYILGNSQPFTSLDSHYIMLKSLNTDSKSINMLNLIHGTMTSAGVCNTSLTPVQITPNAYLYNSDEHTKFINLLSIPATASMETAFYAGHNSIWLLAKKSDMSGSTSATFNLPPNAKYIRGSDITVTLVTQHPDFKRTTQGTTDAKVSLTFNGQNPIEANNGIFYDINLSNVCTMSSTTGSGGEHAFVLIRIRGRFTLSSNGVGDILSFGSITRNEMGSKWNFNLGPLITHLHAYILDVPSSRTNVLLNEAYSQLLNYAILSKYPSAAVFHVQNFVNVAAVSSSICNISNISDADVRAFSLIALKLTVIFVNLLTFLGLGCH